MTSTLPGGAARQLDELSQARPEWAPWLRLLAEAFPASVDPVWDAAVAAVDLPAERDAHAPLLAGAVVSLPAEATDRWLGRLVEVAGLRIDDVDAAALLEATIRQDADRLDALAAAAGADPAALGAIAQVAAMPLLQACARRYLSVATAGWNDGYCPVCGGWPALAEQRGLERARHLRCGRCGADWEIVALRCAFCGTADHELLGSLVPDGEGESRRVETCGHCRGYLKVVAALRPAAAAQIPLTDLATVELDLAALERDYARPATPAVDLGLRVEAFVAGAATAPGARA